MTRRIVLTAIVAATVVLIALAVVGCSKQQAATGGPQALTPATPPVEKPAAAETKPEAKEAPAAETQQAAGKYTYTCPMHPDVKQDKPGKCPECGMFLKADTDEAVEYYCPMHPDVVQDEPGKCPECGMFLEARPKERK